MNVLGIWDLISHSYTFGGIMSIGCFKIGLFVTPDRSIRVNPYHSHHGKTRFQSIFHYFLYSLHHKSPNLRHSQISSAAAMQSQLQVSQLLISLSPWRVYGYMVYWYNQPVPCLVFLSKEINSKLNILFVLII